MHDPSIYVSPDASTRKARKPWWLRRPEFSDPQTAAIMHIERREEAELYAELEGVDPDRDLRDDELID